MKDRNIFAFVAAAFLILSSSIAAQQAGSTMNKDDGKPVINQNVTSHGQSGGITAHTVNQAPAPELKNLSTERSLNADGTQTIKAMVEIVSPYPPAELSLTATGPGIVDFRIHPQRTGMMQFGHTGARDDMHFTSVISPYGRYLITIKAAADAKIKIGYDFK